MTPMHHQRFISASSAHYQCIISASSAHHQCIISPSSVHPQGIISASSVHHQCIISASSAHHQPIISASSVHPQGIISASTAHHQCIISPSSLSWLLPPGGGRGGDRGGLENSSCVPNLGNNSDGQHYNQIWNGSRRLWIMEDHDEKLDQDHKHQHAQVGGCSHSAAQ